ncbi:ABC transporter permease [Subtercola sp. Z020]|uniref:ABC transporter permease n=1 Tax=Subtercola sp. Z020 TaxID=2080582 RepID=UPI000CE7332A|nr:ABC transporter permease [Subtercola sp. Z020]PPF77027.1 ABC transporter permease [Subtercola sp. Z020]
MTSTTAAPTAAKTRLRPRLRTDGTIWFGAALFVLLLILNLASNPNTFGLANLPVTIGFAAPVILAAFAVTPTLLMGNGGIDLSVGPAIGLVNVVVVFYFATRLGLTNPAVLIPVALLLGAFIGLVNGVLVAFVRIQPIVATLGTYLACAGAALLVAPTPGGVVPVWLGSFANTLSFVPIVAAIIIWLVVRRLPFYEHLMAYGGDERAVYTSGISVKLLRIGAFVLGGLFAGIGGLSLSAVLGSADPTVGANYTTLGIAAAALGGVSLAGGRGGLFRALLGALTIFLLQNLLTFWNVSSFALQIAYGVVLVLAVAANGQIGELVKKVSRS